MYNIACHSCSPLNYSRERLILFRSLSGDLFFYLKLWPMWVRRLFWQKPIDDKNAFKLLCFLIGNGCPPLYCCKWILSSQFWNGCYNLCDKLEKRINQMKHFFTKFSSKKLVLWNGIKCAKILKFTNNHYITAPTTIFQGNDLFYFGL